MLKETVNKPEKISINTKSLAIWLLDNCTKCSNLFGLNINQFRKLGNMYGHIWRKGVTVWESKLLLESTLRSQLWRIYPGRNCQ